MNNSQLKISQMSGIDNIIPGFIYIRQKRSKVKAIVVTHEHEYHIGDIAFLQQEVRVLHYATKLTILTG